MSAVLTCLIDFSYHHFALGDTLTWQVTAACLAEERNCSGIDVVLLLNPERPGAPGQGFVSPGNYPAHLENLLPAFMCAPNLRALRIVRDRARAGEIVRSLGTSGAPRWPSLRNHLRQHIKWPLDHDTINAFWRTHRRIPQLGAPKGYATWAREARAKHWPGKFVVAFNPRQSRYSQIPAWTGRDSPLEEWHRFIDIAAERYPDVHFLMLGSYHEWHRGLLKRTNVTIPRALGLSLAHELALLVHADLFMGTSSGFATMATFTGVPYLITNVEPFFAAFVEVKPDSPHYPFARPDQTLTWRAEDAGTLMGYLESMHQAKGRA